MNQSNTVNRVCDLPIACIDKNTQVIMLCNKYVNMYTNNRYFKNKLEV